MGHAVLSAEQIREERLRREILHIEQVISDIGHPASRHDEQMLAMLKKRLYEQQTALGQLMAKSDSPWQKYLRSHQR